MKSRSRFLLPLLALASCSGPAHPLAGGWSQQLPDGKPGIHLEFDGKGEKVVVHAAPRADGTHGHPKATCTWDAATSTVSITGNLVDEGKSGTWTGRLDGDHLELSAADGKLVFHRGGSAHGH